MVRYTVLRLYLLALVLFVTLMMQGCSRLDLSTPSIDLPLSLETPTPIELTEEKEAWEQQRVGAISSLYHISEEGKEALLGLDVRQMRGKPGFFGSYGYKSWTGLGEARPIQVIHELSHAYWGAFPISGTPHLSWDAPRGRISPAMERYHRDVLVFMQQPLDHYEPLRERLRNLPQLSSENLDPLFHTVEADLVYSVAGDLEMLPPILRKYWDRFLRPGPFYDWYTAATWFLALSTDERDLANKYLGFEHFELGDYATLRPSRLPYTPFDAEQVLYHEEQQRLSDFAEQFDLLLGSPELAEDFDFWRRYLRDKLNLHQKHPSSLEGLVIPRAAQIVRALDFYQSLDEHSSRVKARLVSDHLKNEPFIVRFLPILDNRTLLELFASGESLPQMATLKGTAYFVERLKRFTPPVDSILRNARIDAKAGAVELAGFLEGMDFDNVEDLKFLFDLLGGSDRNTAAKVVAALEDPLLRRLIQPVPAHLRSLLEPPRLLEALGITLAATDNEVVKGIEDMVTYPSGNFRIERPFLEELYRLMAVRGIRHPLGTLHIVEESPFPVAGFIKLYPEESVAILSSDLDKALELVNRSDPVLLSPARLVYHLIFADAEFAARFVIRLAEDGEDELVLESLAHFAYDAHRLASAPNLAISLVSDGRFLEELLKSLGTTWLEAQIRSVVELYAKRIEAGEVPKDFLNAHRATLTAAVATLEYAENRAQLEELIQLALYKR